MSTGLLEQARTYREAGEYQLALTCAGAIHSPEGRPEEARALIWLGRFEEALQIAEPAAALLDTAESWIVYSEALVAAGQPEAGRSAAQTARARAARVSVADGDPLPAGQALIALASAVHACGQGDEAAGYARQALSALRDARPYELAQAWQALAESLHVAGRHPDAAEAWRQALSLRRDVLTRTHPEIASTVQGMALTLRCLGLAQISADLHREALAIYEVRLDGEHPAIAAALHGLAQAEHRLGNPTQARDYLARALELSERHQGHDHIHTWVTRFELGRLEVECGDLARGYSRMEATRLRLTEKLGPDHPTVRAILAWLA